MTPFERALATLQTIVDFYAAAAVELPDRRYVTAGDVVADCPQVTVTWAGYPATTGDIASEATSGHIGNAFKSTIYEVAVLRCAPALDGTAENPVLPTAAQFQEYGQVVMRDAEMLEDAIREAHANGVYGEGPFLVLESALPLGPTADLGGLSMRFRVGRW